MVTPSWVKVFCIALKWEDGTQVSPFVSEVSAFWFVYMMLYAKEKHALELSYTLSLNLSRFLQNEATRNIATLILEFEFSWRFSGADFYLWVREALQWEQSVSPKRIWFNGSPTSRAQTSRSGLQRAKR